MLIHEAEELGKNPLVGKQQVMNMRNFQVLRAFAGICKIFAGVFVGRFCRKNNVIISGFCGICLSLRFQNPFKMKTTHRAPWCSAGALRSKSCFA